MRNPDAPGLRRRQLVRITHWPQVPTNVWDPGAGERPATDQEMADQFGILIDPDHPTDVDGVPLGLSTRHVSNAGEPLVPLPEHEGWVEVVGWGGGVQKLARLAEPQRRRILKTRVAHDPTGSLRSRLEREIPDGRARDDRMKDPDQRAAAIEQRSEVLARVRELVEDDQDPTQERKRFQADVLEDDVPLETGIFDDFSGGEIPGERGDGEPVPIELMP